MPLTVRPVAPSATTIFRALGSAGDLDVLDVLALDQRQVHVQAVRPRNARYHDVVAVGRMIGADHMERRTTRGVGITGLANVVSGALGIVGPVDYSMSPGIIAATGCASRFPLIPAGIGLVVCAFFPGFIECLNAIPGVVMGGGFALSDGFAVVGRMQMMIREKAVDGFDGGIVVGFSLMVALLLSFAPDEALNSIPALIRPIVGNGFVMGVITVLILEHLIFRSGKKAKKE